MLNTVRLTLKEFAQRLPVRGPMGFFCSSLEAHAHFAVLRACLWTAILILSQHVLLAQDASIPTSGQPHRSDFNDLASQFKNETDTSVKTDLLLSLWKTKDMRACEIFQRAFRDNDDNIRAYAIHLAISMQCKSTSSAFLIALGDPSPRVRAAAAFGFDSAPDQKAIPNLRRLLNDPDPHVRLYALAALKSANAIDSTSYEAAESNIDASIQKEARLSAPREHLQEASPLPSDNDPEIRVRAAIGLSRHYSKQIAASLREMLTDSDASVRFSAAIALTVNGDPTGEPLFDKLLDQDIEGEGLEGLASMFAGFDRKAALNTLERTFKSRKPTRERENAAVVFGALEDEGTIVTDAGKRHQRLTRMLSQESDQQVVRRIKELLLEKN